MPSSHHSDSPAQVPDIPYAPLGSWSSNRLLPEGFWGEGVYITSRPDLSGRFYMVYGLEKGTQSNVHFLKWSCVCSGSVPYPHPKCSIQIKLFHLSISRFLHQDHLRARSKSPYPFKIYSHFKNQRETDLVPSWVLSLPNKI